MDNTEDPSSKKNIAGLSFRDMKFVSDNTDSISDDLFLEEDITSNPVVYGVKKFLYRVYEKLEADNGIGGFVLDLGKYLSSRFRIVLVFLSVIYDLLLSRFEKIKDSFVRKLFWGRGDFLKSVVQFVSVILIFVVTLTMFYRIPKTEAVSGGYLDYIEVPENDLIASKSSINTLVPLDREKREIETYIVKQGDTLSTIASFFDITVDTIKWANNLTGDLVKPGQELEIPPADGVLVTVSKGDTLDSLSKKYSASDQAIADFNFLDYPFTLVEGQKLFIPEGRMPAPVIATKTRSTPSTYVTRTPTPTGSVGTPDPNVGRFLGWPVINGGKISQYYKGVYHRGIDIADRNLPNIAAAAGGTVIFAGCGGSCPPLGSTWGGSSYGWSIQIDHGNGFTTWYAHLKNIYVRTGQTVSKGQAIGQMGSTGRSTGPHLHFEVRRGVGYGTQVNPMTYAGW